MTSVCFSSTLLTFPRFFCFLFCFALLNSVWVSEWVGWIDFTCRDHRSGVISQLNCSHWLVNAITHSLSICETTIMPERKSAGIVLRWNRVFQISRHVSGLRVVVLKMWVKCDVIPLSPRPPTHPPSFLTPLLSLLMWLLLICILYK